MAEPRRVLFVCYANYCRSPLAEAIFRHLVAARGLGDRFEVDSAGVDAYVGRPPHPLGVAAAAQRGVLVEGAARQLVRDDFYDFDEVLVMDRLVHGQIRRLLTPSAFGPLAPTRARIRLFGEVIRPGAHGVHLDVPDPMGGGPEGFDAAFELIRGGCERLLAEYAPREG